MVFLYLKWMRILIKANNLSKKFIEDVDLDEVFNSIIKYGKKGINFILDKLIRNQEIPLEKQNEDDASYFKRRT